MNTPEIAARLRRAIATMERHGDADVRAVAESMRWWISRPPGAAADFADTLGLPPFWRADLRRRQRDAYLVDLWRCHFPDLKGRPAAQAVARVVRRYQTAGWRRDSLARRRPDGLHGRLFDLLDLGGDLPGPETLRRLFAG